MKRKTILALSCVTALIFAATTGCKPAASKAEAKSAGEPIVVKIGHTDSSSRSTHTWALWLGKYLEEKAPGKFKVEVFSDGQLGDTPDLVAGVKLGTVTMTFDLSAAITAATGPASACIDLPFLYPTYEDWVKGTFENGGLELFNKTLEGSGYYCLDMYYNGMRQVISTKRNYHNADDLRGQKVRVAQNELNIALWKAMGANPTPMAWGEVITSLSQKTIDALDHSLGVFNDFSLHEIAPYLTLTNHASSPFPIITSKAWLDSLPADLRAVFVAGVHEMARQQREAERANEMGYLERFRKAGTKIEELSPSEVAAFIKAVQPVYDAQRKIVGDDVMNAWLATVPKKK